MRMQKSMMGDALDDVVPSRYAQFDAWTRDSEENSTRANETHHCLQDND